MAKKFLTGLTLVNLDSDPLTGSEGELYFNTSASVAKIYKAGAWTELGASTGGGGVTISETAPSSPSVGDLWYKASNGSFAVWDGTYWVEINGVIENTLTQEQIQDYIAPLFTNATNTNVIATYDDENNVINLNTSGSIVNIDSIQYPDFITFDTTPENSSTNAGTIFWDSGDGIPKAVLNANVQLGIGQESVALVKNSTGSSIPKARVVYINGAQGQRPTISLANAGSEPTSSKTFGFTAETIDNGAEGFLVTEGILRGVNTGGLVEGGALWLSLTDGLYTQTIPSPPANSVFLGYVVKASSTAGEIFVKIQNGYELNELHNVLISGSVQNNDILAYNSSTGLWQDLRIFDNGFISASVIPDTIARVSFVQQEIDNIPLEEYLTLAAASSTYLTHVEADANYASKTEAITLAVSASTAAVNHLVDGAPELLNTLNELAAAINDDSNFASTITTALGNKLDISTASSTYLTQVSASTNYATINYVDTEIANIDALPSQTGNNGKFLTTDGSSASWGTIDLSGYLTSEADPVFSASDAAGITSSDISNWDAAYGWGNHASAGYSLNSHNHTLDSLSNVVITGTPTDGQSIVWDSTTSKWVNENVSGGASYPDQSGNNGKFLQTNGSTVSWQNVDFTGYLTESSASTIYLTQASASTTYLTTESDTFETVTDRGATTSNDISITSLTQSTSDSNGALVVSGGVGVGKDLWIGGDLHVNGTTTTQFSKTISTHDNLIYLNAAIDTNITNAVYSSGSIIYTADNTYVAGMDIRVTGVDPSGFNISSAAGLTVASATPTQFIVIKADPGSPYVSGGIAHAKEEVNADLGFAGGYYSGGYAHAGLFRDASDGVFKFFSGYTLEPDESVNIDTGHASFALADISANNATFTGLLSASVVTGGIWNGTAISYQYGGTGLTSLGTANQVLKVNSGGTALEWGTVDALPSQTGNNGKYLTTDGSTASWAILDLLPSQTGNDGKFLTTNGSTTSWATVDLSSYLTQSSASMTYLRQSDASSIYLTQATASSTYAPINSPTFTGTVSGITKSMVGLGNVENTALSTWAGSTNITTVGAINATSVTSTGNVISHITILTPTFTSNAYTLVIGDDGDLLMLNNGSTAGTVNIPTDASVNFPIGTQIILVQSGTGQITVSAASPGTTTLNATPGSKLRAQNSAATLVKTAANTWMLIGDLTA